MNKLKELYKKISSSIWDRIPFSYNMGFKYSEVTITENLLFDIYKFNINNPSLAINIFEAKNEKANGNDLELCLEIEPNKYVILVIQAKKLYFTTQKYRSISHKVNGKYQIDLLEDYAKREKAIPLYMFYNYAPDFKNKNKKYYGCTLAFSQFIRDHYYLKVSPVSWKIPTFDELHQKHHATPLHTLALNGLQIKKTIDKYCKNYNVYTKNELLDNDRWVEIFDKNNQDFSKYTSDEFGVEVDIGTVRETFFASCFESIYYSDVGDFIADGIIYEVGGKNKKFKQIKDVKDSFVVVDTDYSMEQNKIPLWLFGFMY